MTSVESHTKSPKNSTNERKKEKDIESDDGAIKILDQRNNNYKLKVVNDEEEICSPLRSKEQAIGTSEVTPSKATDIVENKIELPKY